MTLTLSENTAIVAMSALSAIKDISWYQPEYRTMVSDALTELLKETSWAIANQHAMDEINQGGYVPNDSDYFPTEAP